MGTAGYMSPEQVRSEKLDARTDIFSFGLVLYEMATGQRAFSGQTAAIVHAAIVNNTPVPVRELNSTLPAKLVTTIDKALEKERHRRYQSAAQMNAALKLVANKEVKKGARPKMYWLLVASLLLVAAAGWMVYRKVARSVAAETPPFEVRVLSPEGNVLEPAALSPDGKYFVYQRKAAGKSSLWLQQTNTGSARKLTPDLTQARLEDVTFSPDGALVFYELRDRETSNTFLYKVAAAGGTPELFVTGAVGAVGFSPKGDRIAYKRLAADGAVQLIVANPDGSDPQALYSGNSEIIGDNRMTNVVAVAPAWSPDGKLIAISEWVPRGGGSYCTISLIDLQGHRREFTGDHQMDFARMEWLPDGSGIVFLGNRYGPEPQHIFMVSYPDARITRITAGAQAYSLKALGLSADGDNIFAIQRSDPEEFWITTDDFRHAQMLSLEGAIALPQSLNFDGRSIFYYSGVGGTDGIWKADIHAPAPVRISPADASAGVSSLSPDGRWIVFSPLKNGRRSIWIADTNGGNVRRLVDGEAAVDDYPVFTADGKDVVFSRQGKDAGLYRVPASGGDVARISDAQLGSPSSTTADGYVLCQYFDRKGPQGRVAVVSLRDGRLVRVFDSPDWNSRPQLTRDGRHISYIDDRDGTSNIWMMPASGGPAQKITNFTSETIYEYVWSLDGKRLALIRGTKRGQAVLIQNWRKPQ
jgi:Tol biopolymer transport system component